MKTQTPIPNIPASNASYAKRFVAIKTMADNGEPAARIAALTYARDNVITGQNTYAKMLRNFASTLAGEIAAWAVGEALLDVPVKPKAEPAAEAEKPVAVKAAARKAGTAKPKAITVARGGKVGAAKPKAKKEAA